jgi:16S rRNA (guanine527-N7)-methyltransferase
VEHLQLTDDEIACALSPYGVSASQTLCEQIRIYISLLLRWNRKVALTTITDPKEILCLHFGESFFAASAAGINEGRVADIGTGAGFPGIPIRMVRPSVKLTLVEPVGKKAAFIAEIVSNLGLSGTDIMRCRMEEMSDSIRDFDFITVRALGRYEELLRWSKARLSQQGKIVLLLGYNEVNKIRGSRRWNWEEPIKIPDSRARFVLIGNVKRE